MTTRHSIESRLDALEADADADDPFADLSHEEKRQRQKDAYLAHLRAVHDNRPADAEAAWRTHVALLQALREE